MDCILCRELWPLGTFLPRDFSPSGAVGEYTLALTLAIVKGHLAELCDPSANTSWDLTFDVEVCFNLRRE